MITHVHLKTLHTNNTCYDLDGISQGNREVVVETQFGNITTAAEPKIILILLRL